MSALAGKRVVLTRAEQQSGNADSLLRAKGAIPYHYPCIKIIPPLDPTELDQALRDVVAGKYDWLVLTSHNTIVSILQRLSAMYPLSLEDAPIKVAAIGPETAEGAGEMLRVRTSLIPEKYVAESLAAALAPEPGTRILLPQGDKARPVLADSLRAAGAEVTTIEAYHVIIGKGGMNVPTLAAQGKIEAITFASSVTAHNFAARYQKEGGDFAHLKGVCIAAIGPITADAVRQIGLSVDVMPDDHTMVALISELETYFAKGTE
jgi:uroporphyrinogen-III synthase